VLEGREEFNLHSYAAVGDISLKAAFSRTMAGMTPG